jgi:hypothetical protein
MANRTSQLGDMRGEQRRYMEADKKFPNYKELRLSAGRAFHPSGEFRFIRAE